MVTTFRYAYKYLNADGTASNGGSGKWHLPGGTRPGKWMPPIKNLKPCERGYHLCRPQDLLKWKGETLWKAEYRGEFLVHDDSKIVAEQARLISQVTTWNDRTQRLFACDCTEYILHFFEEKYPEDKRPREAIEAARRFVAGAITLAELNAAAAAALASAAYAAYASYAAAHASYAAYAAAAYASYAYASSAAEKQWQLQRLMDYIEGRAMTDGPATRPV